MLKAHSTRNTKQFLVSVPPHLPFNIRDSSDSVTHLWPLDQMWAGFTLCESRWLVVWTHRSVCTIKGGSIALLRSFSPLEDCCSCSEKHLFRLDFPWLIHGLWLSSDAVREYTALCFPCTSCLSYRGGCLWWLWCPFSAPHKPPSNLHSLLFCMGTDWWCYRRAESDSTGMELQNTSWLGRHTAVRADSPTSSSWQRNKLYLQLFPSPTPSPPSACVDELRRANGISPSPYLLLSPLSSILTFSSASRSLPWHSSWVQPASWTPVEKTHYLCPSSCLSYLIAPSPPSLFRPVALKMPPDYFTLSLSLSPSLSGPDTLGGGGFHTAWTTWNDTSSSSCGCLFPLLHKVCSLFSSFPPPSSSLLFPHTSSSSLSLRLASPISANNKMLVCVAETLRQHSPTHNKRGNIYTVRGRQDSL